MKIMYLCNVIIGEVATKLNRKKSVFGGWISEIINSIKQNNNNIYYVSPYDSNVIVNINDNMIFYGFDNHSNLFDYFKNVISQINPDVIHIWGTEFKHSFYCVKAAEFLNKLENVVLSLQGFINECGKCYTNYIPPNVVNSWTIGDLARGYNLAKEKQTFLKRGFYEVETIKTVKNIMGRTEWDKSIVYAINKNVNYFYCGETLRREFYCGEKWDINKVEKHSIFICQNNYPIKGFHTVLNVLGKIKDKYPDLKIFTTGKTFTPEKFLDKMKQSSYQKFISKLINNNNLKDSIYYLGQLSATEIKDNLLKTNLLMSPSMLENSPNIIGEAMMLGVPIISSNVGGVSSIISDKEGYLYELGNGKQIFDFIVEIFESQHNIKQNFEIQRANSQYNISKITQDVREIYESILTLNQTKGCYVDENKES